MTEIIWFILVTLFILCIAKYNESNKLFWTLFTSFVLSFAVIKLYIDTTHEKEQSETSFNQAYPMQGLPVASSVFAIIDNVSNDIAPVKATSNPASQVTTPDYVEQSSSLSYVHGVTQGLYLHALPNPPNTS